MPVSTPKFPCHSPQQQLPLALVCEEKRADAWIAVLTSDRAGAFGNGDLNAERRVASASLTSRILGKSALRCTCKLHKNAKKYCERSSHAALQIADIQRLQSRRQNKQLCYGSNAKTVRLYLPDNKALILFSLRVCISSCVSTTSPSSSPLPAVRKVSPSSSDAK